MLKLQSLDYDNRLKSVCANAHCDYQWFVNAIKGAQANLDIQRPIIAGTKAYATLRADLKRGCVLPPIVLTVKNVQISTVITAKLAVGRIDEVTPDELQQIEDSIDQASPDQVYIIDGLQRSNAILQTLSELAEPELNLYLKQSLRLEIWLNIPFGAVAYRMLVLNAGQKPMSMKHQIEVLSMKLYEELSDVDGIDIFTSTEGRRRTRAGQFQLAKLAQAFQAWLQGQPNLDLRNTIMEKMLGESAIETLGKSLEDDDERGHDSFKELISWIVKLDVASARTEIEFFGNETVLLGLAAAVGAAEQNDDIRPRASKCMEALSQRYIVRPLEDHLKLAAFEELRKGFDTAKVNVGQATRDLVFGAFQEHFISDGMKPMDDCWRFAAGRV